MVSEHFSFREKPVYILVLITLLYFYRPIFLGDVFYFRDLYAHFVPTKKLVAEILMQGELPLWNPYLQGGSPLLANPNNMALYPTNLLYLLIPAHRALTVEILIHLLLGMIAMYAFARLLSLDQVSSFIAAVIFGFSGYGFSTLSFLNWLTASAYLPVVFCFWHLYLTQRKQKWLFLSLFAASLQVFAGAPEITAVTFGTLMLWTWFYPYPIGNFRKAFLCIVLVLFTVGICSVLLLPSMELSSVSIRHVGFGFDTSTAWSIHPYRFAELIFPGILGRFDSTAPGAFWGEKLEGANPYFLCIYFGLTAWVLAIVGGFSPQESSTFPRKIRKKLIFMTLLLLILSTAHFLPGISWLYKAFSLRIPFRYPVKLLAAIILPFSLLAAYGSQVLFHSNAVSRKYRSIFWSISAALFVLMALFIFSGSIVEEVSKTVFARSATELMRKTWIGALLHAFSLWTLICLFCETRLKLKHTVVAAVLTLDLLIAGIPYKIFAPAELYTSDPQLARTIKNEIDSGKLFRAPNPAQSALRTPDQDLWWSIRYYEETLASQLASNYGIPVIFHDDQDASSLTEIDYMRIVIGALPWEKKLSLLDAANVRLILTPEQLDIPALRPLARIRSMETTQSLYLYLNQHALTSPTFAGRWLTAKNERDTLDRMTSSEFSKDEKIVIQTTREPTIQECQQVDLHQTGSTFRSKSYEVKTDCDGFLVFCDPAYPGWRVQIDGVRTPLAPANFFYFAVWLDHGRHEIREVYSPLSVRWGLIVTTFSIALVALLANRFTK